MSEEKINLDWLKKEDQMAKKKSDDKEIIDSLAFVKNIRKQVPPDNLMIMDHLDGWEKALHEALFNSVYQKSKRSGKESA
jgi:hypothetical protein